MSAARELLKAALAGQRAWLVGGVVRDRLLGRDTADLDVVLDGDPEQGARRIARAARDLGVAAACFPLSERYGAWRVVAREGHWQVDVEVLRGGSLEADLRLRDFTVNAIAEPVEEGAPIDPLGGMQDIRSRQLRMAAPGAFLDDPLRVLRLVRMAAEIGFEADPSTRSAAVDAVGRLSRVSPERVFAELARILCAPGALRGLELMQALGANAVVLPELSAMHGVQQSSYHHRDVYGHTLEAIERVIELQTDPSLVLGGDYAPELERLLSEPLADGLTRGDALRWGALLHDAAKPATRAVRPADGRVTFIGHDTQGAELAGALLARLRASVRLREHVSALVRHHLRLGFLVREPRPLARETVYDYLKATGPVAVDVTLLSVADRLATRGKSSCESIEAHVQLAREMLPHALHWRAEGPPKPLIRGDELAAELAIETGPRVGRLLEQLTRAQYAGKVCTREQAIAFARDDR